MRVPRHVAIIMDGNGRWAGARALPRPAGHRAGIKPVRMCIEKSAERGVEVLTLFAFSSENWKRPVSEVGLLMQLFLESLDREIEELSKRGIRVRFIGAREQLAPAVVASMASAEALTRDNQGLTVVIAFGYGGRWDIVGAARRLAVACRDGTLQPEQIDEARFGQELSIGELPDPDLFIRTGGEQRISNFLLWNLAYTELWFTDTLWPAFGADDYAAALDGFAERERRFGRTQAAGTDAC
ncbi:MAG: polyprenyl diphosphate synthase [Pseudomonadota bacterium]